MYEQGKRKGVVRFGLKPQAEVQAILLSGDFTQWKPVAMKKQRDGQFVVDVTVPSGTHQYKFLVDGRWVTDPDHSNWARNPFGTMNSIARLA